MAELEERSVKCNSSKQTGKGQRRIEHILLLVLLLCIVTFSLLSCSSSNESSGVCRTHEGMNVCSKCGIDYYRAFYSYIQSMTGSVTVASGSDSFCAYTLDSSNSIYLEATTRQNGVSLITTLKLSDASGQYEYTVRRTSGGIMSGSINANSFSKNTSYLSYSYNSFSSSEKQLVMQYAIERVDAVVNCFGVLLSESNTNITLNNFGFSKY